MLAWLTEAGWRSVMRSAQNEHMLALKLWQSQDWPLVMRRLDADAAPDEVCLGLPLPPDEATGAKIRISLRVHREEIAKTRPATTLRNSLPSAGPFRERLAALCEEAGALSLRVYGSLAMQTLTGMPYLSPRSDVDVLFHPASRQQLDQGIALLVRHAASLPLDGEVVFPGGQAVSWKEWQMAMTHPAKVMVKALQSVRLTDTASLLATLQEAS